MAVPSYLTPPLVAWMPSTVATCKELNVTSKIFREQLSGPAREPQVRGNACRLPSVLHVLGPAWGP